MMLVSDGVVVFAIRNSDVVWTFRETHEIFYNNHRILLIEVAFVFFYFWIYLDPYEVIV
jgi:hypothetical protein